MYLMVSREDIVRIPPERLDEDLDAVIESIARENFEGRMRERALTVLVRDVNTIGVGKMVHGDGGVYQTVKFKALIMRPELQEIVEGYVCDVLKFGAFVRFGPLDALVHISQVMDERISFDQGNQRLVGKDTKKELKMGDRVRARIVALSLNDANPRESKIGFTMRQPGLGKIEWLDAEREAKQPKKESKKSKKAKK